MKKFSDFSAMHACTLTALAMGALLIAACAQDNYDEEQFLSTTTNTQLVSPIADSIVITPSADGKTQTIVWPVVMGAGGYLVSFYDEADEANPVMKDSLVDGCSITVPREEDANYRLEVLAQGNSQLGNTTAAETTLLKYNTFTPSFAEIPDGSDLYEYFTALEFPDTTETIYFDLVAGGNYTLSGVFDFSNHHVGLRTTNKTNFATITYGEGGGLEYCGGMRLKNINFDCSASSEAMLAFSATPAEGILDSEHNNHNQITEQTTLQNLNITGLKSYLLFDNKKKYCLKTFYMENCLIHLESVKMQNNAVFQIYDGGGFINDFTMISSTIWNTGESDQKYFIRYSNAGRCDRAGYDRNSINIMNSTFYNICKAGQMCNHSGFDGRATSDYTITDNIFVDCGSGQVPRRIIARYNDAANIVFNNNTYWFDGASEDPTSASTYDKGYILITDPAFEDAANGDFTPTGSEQVSLKTGDPRWFE